jgi:rsbT co-antagonist protein RsbR
MEHNPRTARRILAVARLAGVSRSDPATFNFSMKEPLFTLLREEGNPKRLVDHIWTVTKLRDKLGLYTTEVYAQSREDILNRQAQELLELPRLWLNCGTRSSCSH